MNTALTDVSQVPTQTWEISDSIPDLAYLTHNFFRYYGKFPSILARNLIREYALPNHVVLDSYAGSGTTLVEAKLAKLNSIGIDINPLGVLACRVKCRSYNIDELRRRWQHLSELIEQHYSFFISTEDIITKRSEFSYDESLALARHCLPRQPKISKWFGEREMHGLAILKSCLLQLPMDEYREFFTLAFFAIIRRASRAFDGEIRPHVNKDKTPRPVWKAYSKKVREMLIREQEWITCTNREVWSIAKISDNRNLSTDPLIQETSVGQIIAHPPYLNSFDYLPAYSLEFDWSEGFNELWGSYDLAAVKQAEIRAWPATNQQLYDSYFDSQARMLEQCFKVLVPGGTCCVVIGDATIRGKLIPVHLICAKLGQDAGFLLERIIYRTTHYGVGKYAYRHRADYHDNGDGKKDGVLIFRKSM
jgi:DNA modification methylase